MSNPETASTETRERQRVGMAGALMSAFVERTGVGAATGGTAAARRYLWTDAFAVRNLLALARATGEERWTRDALALVDDVHRTLGRHRADDPRSGWLSGLDDVEGARHPTRAGLRIGKPLPERGPDEPWDERLEWERDGQYFHYLTKWMQALDLVAHHTGRPEPADQARELAWAATRAFVRDQGEGELPQMVWKMSVDLSRPQVASMGHHDPLDGYVTMCQLRASAPSDGVLRDAQETYASIVAGQSLATGDLLGLGGLLADAWRLAQLPPRIGGSTGPVLLAVLDAARRGLQRYAARQAQLGSAESRLAFRELGLARGLALVARLAGALEAGRPPLAELRRAPELVRALAAHRSLGHGILAFWLRPVHRRVTSWTAHQDINDVMLASALLPVAEAERSG